MNAEELKMLHFPQDVNTNKKCPRSILPSFINVGKFSPHTYGCYAFSTSLFSNRNHFQPATAHSWNKFNTFQACVLRLFRCSCSTGMQHTKHAPDHPCKLIFPVFLLLKSKSKRTLSPPTVSLMSMRRVVTWHIWAGGEQRVCKLRQISHPAVESDGIQKMLSTFSCIHTFAYCIDFSTSATEGSLSWKTYTLFVCVLCKGQNIMWAFSMWMSLQTKADISSVRVICYHYLCVLNNLCLEVLVALKRAGWVGCC